MSVMGFQKSLDMVVGGVSCIQFFVVLEFFELCKASYYLTAL